MDGGDMLGTTAAIPEGWRAGDVGQGQEDGATLQGAELECND